jgi:hypothetical protein
MSTLTLKAESPNRIRGPNLAVFLNEGILLDRAFDTADRAGLVIASNKRLSQALVGNEEWKAIIGQHFIWSGTLVAYLRLGKRLKNVVEWTDPETASRWIFPVPEFYKGMRDAMLVTEHPDFRIIEDGRYRIVDAARVGIVEKFPRDEGWNLGDPKYDIPTGTKADEHDSRARYMNSYGGKCVRCLVRDYYGEKYGPRFIDADFFYKTASMVLVEYPAPGLGYRSSRTPPLTPVAKLMRLFNSLPKSKMELATALRCFGITAPEVEE